ncbi:MAG: hypothetical protein Q8883_02565, partial [Sweet potato little leaf phytoplasma]|nr:hypothetical protein [Sweet potato little leaf phytoplasma]
HDENIFTYRKSIHDNQIYIKEDIVHFQTGQVLVKADTLLDDKMKDLPIRFPSIQNSHNTNTH